jgi:hypothetical protein
MYLHSYTKALKRYDPDLYAGHSRDGLPCVFRRTKRYEPVCEFDGVMLLSLIADKELVLALTDNWQGSGKPREWGIDHVLRRVRETDVLANERFFDQLDESNEKIDQAKKRSFRNEMEGFWSYERRRFAKATDDILTHSLSHDEPKKRLKEKSIKNGNNQSNE